MNENQVYTMMYLIDIPIGTNIPELQEVLSKKMAGYGVTIGLRHQALFKMVNEI
jgi:predicted amino acid-binding ACT domain protein